MKDSFFLKKKMIFYYFLFIYISLSNSQTCYQTGSILAQGDVNSTTCGVSMCGLSDYMLQSIFGYATTTLTVSTNTTLLADLFVHTLTVNTGIALNTNGYRIFVSGELTNNGFIQNNGGNGIFTGGLGANSGTIGGGSNGGNGVNGGHGEPGLGTFGDVILAGISNGGDGGIARVSPSGESAPGGSYTPSNVSNSGTYTLYYFERMVSMKDLDGFEFCGGGIH